MADDTGDNPAVHIDGLVKRYGDLVAVDHLSLQVPRRTVLALLGPNGAGKTSIVEICEGLRRADAGTVRVLGRDPVTQRRELRPRIAAMLQNCGAYQAARAAEMLRLVASYARHPVDPDVLLDRLGLRAVSRTPFRRLSAGNSNVSRSPWRSSAARSWFSSTNQPRAWTRRLDTPPGKSSQHCAPQGSLSCSRRTT